MQKIGNFLKSFQIKKLLENKRFTVTLSIVLSFVLWLVIVTSQKTVIERPFSDIPVTVNLDNTFVSDNGMNIIGDISGASYAVSSIKSGDITVYASAASVDAPGEYNLEVVASKSNPLADYQIKSVTPSNVKITFDYIDTKEFAIKAKAEGVTAKEGLIAESAIVSGTEKDTVTISGPRTVINKIDSVVAFAQVNKTLDVNETFDADLILYDAEGKELSAENLTLSAEKVKLTVPISKTKTVPIVVDFTNVPNGFNKESISYTLDYSTVTVIGKPETVDKITNVTLSAIDLSSVSPTANSYDVSPKLPEGVRLVENMQYVTVKLNIENYSQKIIAVSEIKHKGLESGLSVSEMSEIKNVRICGPRNIINRLNTAYAEIDLTGKTAGQHSVEAVISFKDANTVWAIGTYTTTVLIK